MATWCVACVEEMPEFRALRGALSEADLAIVAVPVDGEDTTEMLEAWSAKHQPPYEIVTGLASSEVDRVNAVTLAELRAEAVPATFVTNRDGNVLMARWGVPTVSDIRRLLWQDRAKRREASSAIVASRSFVR